MWVAGAAPEVLHRVGERHDRDEYAQPVGRDRARGEEAEEGAEHGGRQQDPQVAPVPPAPVRAHGEDVHHHQDGQHDGGRLKGADDHGHQRHPDDGDAPAETALGHADDEHGEGGREIEVRIDDHRREAYPTIGIA